MQRQEPVPEPEEPEPDDMIANLELDEEDQIRYRIRDIVIGVYSQGWFVSKINIHKETGKAYLGRRVYPANLTLAMQTAIDWVADSSDASTLREYLDEYKKAIKELAEVIRKSRM